MKTPTSYLTARFLVLLLSTALVVFGAVPARAAQNWCVTSAGTLVIDQGGDFYADASCQLAAPTGAATNARTVERPLMDFLGVQGTFCFPDGLGGCRIFNPGVPNFITWRDDSRNRKAAVDYAGLVPGFGTVITGSLTDTRLKDGRALVRVDFAASNAFTWAVSGNSTATSPVIFGNRIDEVLAGAAPALGSATLRIDIIKSAPGAPLPDLVPLLSFQGPSGSELRSLTFTSDSFGELHAAFGVPEGTPGEATVTVLNLQMNGIGPVVPVNNIMVEVAP